jgi:hypothetical protein
MSGDSEDRLDLRHHLGKLDLTRNEVVEDRLASGVGLEALLRIGAKGIANEFATTVLLCAGDLRGFNRR